MRLKTTLDQWLTLLEVDRAGSIQAAALKLNKSHTTLIYAIKKLERQLGLSLLEIEGRRAVLTHSGKSLLRRAQSMIEQAQQLEDAGNQLAQNVESDLVVAVDHLCDRSWLYEPVTQFFMENSTTSIQVIETSLSETTNIVEEGKADISIINLPITNHPAEAFGLVTMLPVVSKSHPLASKRNLCLEDLAASRQIVVRDLGQTGNRNVGWLKSNQRITVDNFDHAWQATQQGLGYCRLPSHLIEKYANNEVVTLIIENSSCYQVPLHLTLPKGSNTGPAAKTLYQLLLASVNSREC